ncbi:MAG: hypothetical protein K2N38_07955 [Oscillospiraceae bacterium]|nr:hypothetical protein [Oscillospiraceae bacterium]
MPMNEMRGIWQGKRVDNGEWITGDLSRIKNADQFFIDNYTVDPSTLGECTGLPDKNGNPIFEGNQISFETISGSIRTGTVFWYGGVWYVDGRSAYGTEFIYRLDYVDFKSVEIICDIHDNPGLMKDKVQNDK